MKKVYLSGKISGLSKVEYRANFDLAARAAARFFSKDELEIVNPALLPEVQNTWADYIIRDLMLLKDCDVVVMLPFWYESRGAKIEHHFAQGHGIKVLYMNRDYRIVVNKL